MNLEAHVNVQHLATSDFFDVFPSQYQLLFLTKNGLLGNVELVLGCVETEGHEEEVVARDDNVSPEWRLDSDLLALEQVGLLSIGLVIAFILL